jgi:hypothetical protein
VPTNAYDSHQQQPRTGKLPTGGGVALAQLLGCCAHRDEQALLRFYEITSPWVYRLIQQGTVSASEAEGAMVAVYTTVWRRAAGFADVDRTALGWITSITFEVAGAMPKHPLHAVRRS